MSDRMSQDTEKGMINEIVVTENLQRSAYHCKQCEWKSVGKDEAVEHVRSTGHTVRSQSISETIIQPEDEGDSDG